MQKLVTAHDIHHYERRLEHALASLDEDRLVSKKIKRLCFPTSGIETRRD